MKKIKVGRLEGAENLRKVGLWFLSLPFLLFRSPHSLQSAHNLLVFYKRETTHINTEGGEEVFHVLVDEDPNRESGIDFWTKISESSPPTVT